MAAAIRFVDKGPMDSLAWRVVEVSADSSYPTGGYTLDNAATDMKKIISIEPITHVGYAVEWNPVTSKLLFYKNQATSNSNPLAEVPAATNLTGVVVRVLVIGEHR